MRTARWKRWRGARPGRLVPAACCVLAFAVPVPARGTAVEALPGAMASSGLQGVDAIEVPGDPPLVVLTGALPGTAPESGEIALVARVDAAPGSPGGVSAAEIVLSAVADLRRTPLSRAVRVVFVDGAEVGRRGSRAWLEGLPAERRDRMLAGLVIEEAGGPEGPGPVIRLRPVRRGGERVVAPGWLVHAVLAAGEAVGAPFALTGSRVPLLGQLVARAAGAASVSDADSFLGQGVPAVALSGGPALGAAPAAAVRRLDALAGRPLPEDDYLVALGRVWLRRDLYWIGFTLWAVLVFRGRPGRWRGASAEEHRRQQRRYLPGYAFRLAFLLAMLLAPVFSVLLWPAALLAIAPPRRPAMKGAWLAAGLLPAAVFLVAVAAAFGRGAAEGWVMGAPQTLVLAAALGSYGLLVWRKGPDLP